jgi:hypothetical protein
MSALEVVNDSNWKEFTSSPLSVLLVTESECPHCNAWKGELSDYLEANPEHIDCRFGVVTLDSEEVRTFKEANDEWLQIIDGLPFTVIYLQGEPKTSFYGAGVKRLLKRLERIEKD